MSTQLRRILILSSKFRDRAYRESYVGQHLKTFLANQIRALRGSLSQVEFGRLLEKPQSVVSRLESNDYGKLTLQTLLEIAAKMDVALIVRFVSHETFLQMTSDFSPEAYRPPSYEKGQKENAGKIKGLTWSAPTYINAAGTSTEIKKWSPLRDMGWSPINKIKESVGLTLH